ncbi:MAG TPA: primase-like DNA-binding domain-containing protein [Desulfobacterales bacterium]|nr:primase-like DNA-binding domain-containing protein [Desulfobacterales bacterium]
MNNTNHKHNLEYRNFSNEIDGVIKIYRDYFNDFADSLKFIGFISMESGCKDNDYTYRLVAAMLKEREDTFKDLFDEFADELNFTAKEILKEDYYVTCKTNSYSQDEDNLGSFIDEYCTLGPHNEIGASKLYDVFKNWSEENISKSVISQKKFGQIMTKRFKKFRDSSGRYVYDGLILKEK